MLALKETWPLVKGSLIMIVLSQREGVPAHNRHGQFMANMMLVATT